MKETKKTEIAINKSSGAEKVEEVEKQLKTSREENDKPVVTVKKTTQTSSSKRLDSKEKEEKAAAKARVEAALKKQEEKKEREQRQAQSRKERVAARKAAAEKRLAERKAAAEKRLADRKAAAEKRKAERKARAEKREAERKARAEKRKAEREQYVRERAHQKANRSQARERAKSKRRKENGGREGRSQGYGTWLAAVITLGVVTLVLTTLVTLGTLELQRINDGTMSGYKSTTYELMGIMEHVDDDLDRVRVSASPVQQERILTDLLVQARLAELDLEKMPVPAEEDKNITSFINRVATTSERLLTKLRLGGTLSAEDTATLQKLYETNHQIKAQLGELSSTMDDNMIKEYLKKGEGAMKDLLNGLEKLTLEENRLDMSGKMEKKEGAGTQRNAIPDASDENGAAKIDPAKAEEICKNYFTKYQIQDFQCIGETVARGYTAYNLQGYDDKGTLLFAEVDCNSGALVRFNYYEPCNNMNFDVANAQRIAEEFLQTIGYDDMAAMRVSENGTDADFTFVYQTEGVMFHPDAVKIKVCRERGVVTAFDAARYLRNHKERSVPEVAMTIEQAQSKLHESLTVEGSTLAIVQARGGERAAYEFLCSFGEEKYFVYTDANTGDELAIVNVKNLG